AVVWAGIETPTGLAALAESVDGSLAGCGIARETRPFAPHLTLARLKDSRLSATLLDRIERSKNEAFGSQISRSFALMESKTKPTGAEYTTLQSFSFAREEQDL